MSKLMINCGTKHCHCHDVPNELTDEMMICTSDVTFCKHCNPEKEEDLLLRAKKFAEEKHKGQTYSGTDFMFHPNQTAVILIATLAAHQKEDDNLIAAALLHDTLEDTETTYEELLEEFGEDIANLVKEVTDDGWNVFPHLKTQRGIMLKFADRLANLSNMDKWKPDRKERYIQKSKFWKDKS